MYAPSTRSRLQVSVVSDSESLKGGLAYSLRPDLAHELTPFFNHYRPYFGGNAEKNRRELKKKANAEVWRVKSRAVFSRL